MENICFPSSLISVSGKLTKISELFSIFFHLPIPIIIFIFVDTDLIKEKRTKIQLETCHSEKQSK